jgi:hypothetical protein
MGIMSSELNSQSNCSDGAIMTLSTDSDLIWLILDIEYWEGEWPPNKIVYLSQRIWTPINIFWPPGSKHFPHKMRDPYIRPLQYDSLFPISRPHPFHNFQILFMVVFIYRNGTE